jgi:hypothetical protein
MKIINALHGKALFIGNLEDCISVCTLEHETAFLNASQVEELIQELETRLKEMNGTDT